MGSARRDPAEEAGEAGEVPLSRVLAQVERQLSRRLEAVLSAASLTPDQWRVLDVLADGRGHPMSEIAAQIVVPGPTLTKIVDRLVDGALVYRLVDETDRRRVLVFASEDGRDRHRAVQPRVRRLETEFLALPDVEGAQLSDLLGRLAAGLRAPAGETTLGSPA